MKRYGPIQRFHIAQAFVVSFFLLLLAWALVSRLGIGTFFVSPLILGLTAVLAAVLTFIYYRDFAHQVLAYDENGFEFQAGRRTRVRMRWEEFRSVSVYHLGGGRFAVRLYQEPGGGGNYAELPATAVGLDAGDLRAEIERYLRKDGGALTPPPAAGG